MSTRSEQERVDQQIQNSERNRTTAREVAERPTERDRIRAGQEASHHGRALHAPTSLQADAKAMKREFSLGTPGERMRPNGGEEETLMPGFHASHGADGTADAKKPSRKSTRGAVAGGEKASNTLTTRAQNAMRTPTARAQRGK